MKGAVSATRQSSPVGIVVWITVMDTVIFPLGHIPLPLPPISSILMPQTHTHICWNKTSLSPIPCNVSPWSLHCLEVLLPPSPLHLSLVFSVERSVFKGHSFVCSTRLSKQATVLFYYWWGLTNLSKFLLFFQQILTWILTKFQSFPTVKITGLTDNLTKWINCFNVSVKPQRFCFCESLLVTIKS